MKNQMVCSCGQGCTGQDAHEIMSRTTLDGKTVVLWSDGAITGALGVNIQVYPSRTKDAIAAKVAQGRDLLSQAWCWTWAELFEND